MTAPDDPQQHADVTAAEADGIRATVTEALDGAR